MNKAVQTAGTAVKIRVIEHYIIKKIKCKKGMIEFAKTLNIPNYKPKDR